MTNETAIVEAQFQELERYSQAGGMVVAPSAPSIADMWGIVPIPQSWIEEGYKPDYKSLYKPTPRSQIKLHPKQFRYISVDYFKRRLNEAFGRGRWVFRVTGHAQGRSYTQTTQRGQSKQYIEIIAEGYLLCPGLPPQYGVGSAPWAQDDQSDPRFSLAVARNSAESNALKNAARKLGIGSDVNEDEQSDAVLLAQRKTAQKMFDELVKIGETKTALDIVRKRVPGAIQGESIDVDSIDEDNADSLTKELTNALVAAKQAQAEKAKES